MAIQRGQAGRSTRDMESKRGLRREGILLLILVVGMGFLFIYSRITPHITKLGGIGGVIAIFAILIVFKFIMSLLGQAGRKAKKEERRAGRGARAEEKMGNLFDSMPDDYLVLNDVVCGHGNIDHLILSRTKGVFVIETKSHHGRVTADGSGLLLNGHPTEKDFINQTLGNCLWLKEWIKQNLQMDAWVTGVIVYTNAYVEVRQPIRGVHVINKGFLQRFLERQRDNPRAGELWERRNALEPLMKNGSDACPNRR